MSGIGLTCYDMDKKILLDNYTLRVTGAGAAVFFLLKKKKAPAVAAEEIEEIEATEEKTEE